LIRGKKPAIERNEPLNVWDNFCSDARPAIIGRMLGIIFALYPSILRTAPHTGAVGTSAGTVIQR